MVEEHHGDAALLANSGNTKFVPFTSIDLVVVFSKLMLIAFSPLFTRLENDREGIAIRITIVI